MEAPAGTFSRAILGVYEMTRVELLRDLYLWAYERSVQEYMTIRQNMADPDPGRLAWRILIKQTIREVVTHPELDALDVICAAVAANVPAEERENVQALVVEELRRLHEGVIARYGLRPAEFAKWRSVIR
jgi:hypothetical protein